MARARRHRGDDGENGEPSRTALGFLYVHAAFTATPPARRSAVQGLDVRGVAACANSYLGLSPPRAEDALLGASRQPI